MAAETSPPSRRRRLLRGALWTLAALLGLLLICVGVAVAVAWDAMGKAPQGARMERMADAPQWQDGGFANPQPIYNDFAGWLTEGFGMGEHAEADFAFPVAISGDTGLFDDMAKIGERYGPFDLVMMEVGAYHRTWPDWHIGPEQALVGHRMLKGRLFMPIHWGLFNLALHGWTEPAERVWIAGSTVADRGGAPGDRDEERRPQRAVSSAVASYGPSRSAATGLSPDRARRLRRAYRSGRNHLHGKRVSVRPDLCHPPNPSNLSRANCIGRMARR